jgi:CheY-like chemotaxis protein
MEGIGLLAGGIAHDFNNILTVIRGNATLALAALPPEEGPREDLAQIVEAADRAADLIRQLLAFARRTVLKPEVVELGTIVRRLEPMLRRLIGEDVTLVTAAQGAGSVLADPGQIEQIIINLAVNARDAMPDGGKLTIETADIETAGSASPMTAMSVSDTGMGMDAATMDHLFEPFFTTKGLGKGTGLGLATVYGIVNQSGGTVTAHSQPGHGSTFTVCLPRVAAITAAAEPARPTATEGSRLGTILVVEDDTGVRRFVRRVLEAAGYLVLTAPDGATAIEASLGVPLQLLLTDVVMPDMSGRRVAAKLASERPGIRVLYMSGYPDDDIVRHGVLEPDIDLLAKPFTAEALLSAMDKALARGAAD